MNLIIGQGSSNQSIVEYFKKHKINYIQVETLEEIKLSISKIKNVYKAPGIPNHDPRIKYLIDKKFTINTEINLALSKIKNQKIIAITGSNGKSTIAYQINEILQKLKQKSQIVGNYGIPFISKIEEDIDFFVLELSSFQLECLNDFTPDIAIITNIVPTHLEYHESFENYQLAKLNITKNQQKDQKLILDESFKINFKTQAKIVEITHKDYQDFKNEFLIGEHNLKNLAFAKKAIELLGFENIKDQILKYIQEIRPLKHRLEVINQKPLIINDSKATNIDAAINDILSVNKVCAILIGGKFIEQDISKIFTIPQIKEIYLYGEAGKKIFENTQSEKIKYYDEDFKNASLALFQSEERVKILIPAYPSFDQFKNFEERGETFLKIWEER